MQIIIFVRTVTANLVSPSMQTYREYELCTLLVRELKYHLEVFVQVGWIEVIQWWSSLCGFLCGGCEGRGRGWVLSRRYGRGGV